MKLALQNQKHRTSMSCGRCSHEWTYRGLNKWVACCPHCRTYNSIKKNRLQVDQLPTKQSVVVVNPKEFLNLS